MEHNYLPGGGGTASVNRRSYGNLSRWMQRDVGLLVTHGPRDQEMSNKRADHILRKEDSEGEKRNGGTLRTLT